MLTLVTIATFGETDFFILGGLQVFWDLDKHGVPLYRIVHENVGVQEFKIYLKGDIYLDEQVMKHSNKAYTIYCMEENLGSG